MIRLAAVIVIALMLAGCTAAGPSYIPIDSDHVKEARNIRVLSIIPQDEILAVYKETGSGVSLIMPGGLGTLIDAVVKKQKHSASEKWMNILRPAASKVDFRKEYWDKLRAEVERPGRFVVAAVVRSDKAYSEQAVATLLDSMSEEALLILETAYLLTNEFKILAITGSGKILVKGESRPAYLESFAYRYSLDITGPSAIAAWAEQDAALYQEKLREGIDWHMLKLRAAVFGGPP